MTTPLTPYITEITEWKKRNPATPGATNRIKKRFENYEAKYRRLQQQKGAVAESKIHALLEIAEKEFKTYKRLEILGQLAQ
jgi:hypothetical protein